MTDRMTAEEMRERSKRSMESGPAATWMVAATQADTNALLTRIADALERMAFPLVQVQQGLGELNQGQEAAATGGTLFNQSLGMPSPYPPRDRRRPTPMTDQETKRMFGDYPDGAGL